VSGSSPGHDRPTAAREVPVHQRGPSYNSHSVIVIEVGQDTKGRFAFCVGGNETDSVRRTVVRLNAAGFIKQRPGNPFICVIKDLK
jgi:hypothetical protein